MLKLIYHTVEMNNMGATGQFLSPKSDFEHARTYFCLRILGHDRHTDNIYIYIYISHEISIEHHSVGLTSLAQLHNLDDTFFSYVR